MIYVIKYKEFDYCNDIVYYDNLKEAFKHLRNLLVKHTNENRNDYLLYGCNIGTSKRQRKSVLISCNEYSLENYIEWFEKDRTEHCSKHFIPIKSNDKNTIFKFSLKNSTECSYACYTLEKIDVLSKFEK